MKRYPKYKDSGANWLGQVPEHWELGRLGSCVSLRGEKGSDKEFEPLSVTKNGIVPQLETAAKTDDGENRKVVRKGDIAINGRSDRKGSSGLAEMDGSVSLINIILKIDRGLYPKFAHHLIRSVAFQEEFYRWGRGIVADLWSTNYWDLKRIPTALPPISEQVNIVNYIDLAVAKMDSAISSQERMIQLLKERRSAIITQAVTKGLDPNAKMKDSGVPWLGQVPAHWEVKRGRFLFRVNGGFGSKSRKLECAEVQFLPMEKIGERNDLNLDTVRAVDDKANSYVECLEGDVIVAKVTPCFENGKGAVARGLTGGAALATSEVHTLRPYEASADFVYYSTLGGLYRQAGAAEMYGVGGLRRVPPLFFKDARLAVPAVGEQAEIVAHLKKSISKMDSAISSQERLIELLKERRSAIITQAVTGQIDVR